MGDDELIRQAMTGDISAFTDLVLRHQGMVFGYALAILRDYHLAEDATQESFIAAYYSLAALHEPGALPSWLRGIVRHQCARLVRRKRIATVALAAGADIADREPTPEQAAEVGDGVDAILSMPPADTCEKGDTP